MTALAYPAAAVHGTTVLHAPRLRPGLGSAVNPPAGADGGLPGGSLVLGPWVVLAVIVAVLAIVGFRYGVRRQAVALVLTAMVYWGVGQHWPAMAGQLAPLLPGSGSFWQLGVFATGVFVSYFLGRRLAGPPAAPGTKLLQSLPLLLERLMGLGLGGATGYMVGRFSLLRLPSGEIGTAGPQQDVRAILEGQLPVVVWLTIGIIILFGVVSLRPRKRRGQ
jgi:hypothetical protein